MKHKNHNQRKSLQRGNVLFMILIAIALFAAFTAAVTQSNSGGGGGEQSGFYAISATQIMRYGSTVKSAVDSLRQRGISESDISFANATITGYGTVDTNPKGEVFHVSGGGITYEVPNENWFDGAYSNQTGYGEWIFTGVNSLNNVGTWNETDGGCTQNDCTELLLILPYVREEICKEIIKSLSLNEIEQDNASFGFTKFNGSFSYAHQIVGDTIAFNGTLPGQFQACVEGDSAPTDGSYHYYQVLIAR